MSSTPRAWAESLLKSPRFSDVTIRCGTYEFPAHKTVLSIQSHYFDKAFEQAFKEAEEGVLRLEDEDPAVVECLLQYFYLGSYSFSAATTSTELSRFELHIRLYCLADQLQILPLKDLVCKEIPESVEASILDGTFQEIATLAYENTRPQDRLLREFIAYTASERVQDILMDNEASLKDNEASLKDNEASLKDNEASLKDNEASLKDNEASLKDNAEFLFDVVKSMDEKAKAYQEEIRELKKRLEISGWRKTWYDESEIERSFIECTCAKCAKVLYTLRDALSGGAATCPGADCGCTFFIITGDWSGW